MDWMFLAFVCCLLIMFGIIYNWLMDHLGERKEGYVSLMVVGGVLVTGIGFAVVAGIEDAIILAILFVASGTPMIIGEIARIIRLRRL